MIRKMLHNEVDNMRSKFDTAQICLNGHVITDRYSKASDKRQVFCDKCGQPTITACTTCYTAIKGDYNGPGVVKLGSTYTVPAFCHGCGEPFPWTWTAMTAAKELVNDLDNLSDTEKSAIKSSIDDMVRNTPRTTLAATRFKNLIAKAGDEAEKSLQTILTGIIPETAENIVWPK
jgi:hypothetical protein